MWQEQEIEIFAGIKVTKSRELPDYELLVKLFLRDHASFRWMDVCSLPDVSWVLFRKIRKRGGGGVNEGF